MRKLRVLSLAGNLISNLQKITFAEPLIELRELDLSQNKLRSVEALKNVPNLEELSLNGNPIAMVFPEAFSSLNHIQMLRMNGLRFKNPYDGDLMFLKMVEGTLRELNLDFSFPDRNLEQLTHSFPLMKFAKLTVLSLEDVGLI